MLDNYKIHLIFTSNFMLKSKRERFTILNIFHFLSLTFLMELRRWEKSKKETRYLSWLLQFLKFEQSFLSFLVLSNNSLFSSFCWNFVNWNVFLRSFLYNLKFKNLGVTSFSKQTLRNSMSQREFLIFKSKFSHFLNKLSRGLSYRRSITRLIKPNCLIKLKTSRTSA